MNLRACFLVLALASCCTAYAQRSDTAAVIKLLDKSKSLIGSDSAKALNLAGQAKKMSSDLGYSRGEAYALKNIGLVYYMRGMYVQTLDYWNQSLEVFERIQDDMGIANILGNIGAIYFNQGADDKALEYTLKSLQIAEKLVTHFG